MGILIGLSAAALIGISIRTAHHYGWGEDPIAVVHDRPSSLPPIDLNSASWEELTLGTRKLVFSRTFHYFDSSDRLGPRIGMTRKY